MNWKNVQPFFLLGKAPYPYRQNRLKLWINTFVGLVSTGGGPFRKIKDAVDTIFQESLYRDPSKPTKGDAESTLYIDSATAAIS